MKKRHEGGHERGEHEHGPEGDGKERAAFLRFLAGRWRGSAPPTAAAYSRALLLWRRLPGAVTTKPADLATAQSTPAADVEKGGRREP